MREGFRYSRPQTVEEACREKARWGKGARFWAGGTDLLVQWRDGRIEVQHCIDITFLRDLNCIVKDEGGVHIGALSTLASICASPVIGELVPILGTAAGQMATPQLRNIATIGGNLCNAAPSADLAPPLIALGATARVAGPDTERCIPVEEFFLGPGETALREGELLLGVTMPVPSRQKAFAFLKVRRTCVDIAVVNVAIGLATGPDGVCADARIVLGAVAPVPMRAKLAERALVGRSLEEMGKEFTESVGKQAAAETRPISDVRASADYRRQVSGVLVRRGLESVIEQLRGRTT